MKKLQFLIVLALSSFLFSEAMPTKKHHVISEYSGGRLGDNLLAFAHTFYFALKNDVQLHIVPFNYSNQFNFDNVFPQYHSNSTMNLERKVFASTGDVFADNPTKNTLFIVPYFPQASIEYTVPHSYKPFYVDWDNESFKEQLRTLIAPKVPLTLIKPITNKITVAVHARRGGGVDDEDQIHKGLHLYKTPFDQYFINQIRDLSNLLDNKPLYVFVFTDDKDPVAVVENYKAAVNIPTIEFDCRKQGNSHDANVLEDLFSMMHFDVLIRPDSTYSIMAEKLGYHSIIISTGKFIPGTLIQEGIFNIKKPLN